MARIIPNDDEFLGLWMSGERVVDIAGRYGVNITAIYQAAEKFGFPPVKVRKTKTTPTAKPKANQPQACPQGVPGSPFWTQYASKDELVWNTGGVWSKLSKVAVQLGTPTQNVTARWHLLSAAAKEVTK